MANPRVLPGMKKEATVIARKFERVTPKYLQTVRFSKIGLQTLAAETVNLSEDCRKIFHFQVNVSVCVVAQYWQEGYGVLTSHENKTHTRRVQSELKSL